MCTETGTGAASQSGASLIELVMFIVIVSTALGGVLLIMNQANGADPLIRKQATTAAYSLLEEIESRDFMPAAGAAHARTTQANRTAYHTVGDYDGFAASGIFPVSDEASASPILTGYEVTVSVRPLAPSWNGIAAGGAVQIRVIVTAQGTGSVVAVGYRTAHR